MIIAHHLIFTAYGWWLPNDPRGSSSHDIRVMKIDDLGDHHYGRKQVQPLSREIKDFDFDAEQRLRHPLFLFDDEDIAIIAEGLRDTIQLRHTPATPPRSCRTTSILRSGVHRDRAEDMLGHFQDITRQLLKHRQRRSPTHPVWGGPGW